MSAEKPFAPTRERLRRAAREGDLPRSPDLTSLGSFAAGSLALAAVAGPVFATLRGALERAARGASDTASYLSLAACTAAVFAASAAGGALATLLQMGRFVVVMPAFKPSRLSPLAGFRRMASRETIVAALKALAAAAALGAAFVPLGSEILAVAVGSADAAAAAALAANAVPRIAIALAAVGAVFAGFDLALQHASRRRRLRMSLQEYRDDLKASDGDPSLRLRRRSAHRSRLRASFSRLREAAFVVVNPQHIAIALEYEPPRVEVPRVLLRAHDSGALEMRRRAAELEIPVVEDVALARALDAQARAGEYIPADLYGPVARIVAALSASFAT